MQFTFMLLAATSIWLTNVESLESIEGGKNSIELTPSIEVAAKNLHGRWHLVEIVVELDRSNGLGTKAESSFERSSESQRKVKRQIEEGQLAIITQFNFDGTYTHELVYADPSVRFPSYREAGSWRLEEGSGKLTRKSSNKDVTTLETTTVKHLTDDKLVLIQVYTDKEFDGVYKGFVETIYLKRFYETKAQ